MSEYKCKICGKKISEYEHAWEDDICFVCRKTERDAETARMLQENEETETCYEDEMVCPYCGYRIQDDDGYFAGEQYGEYECPECEKTFCFKVNIEVTYSTKRKVEE